MRKMYGIIFIILAMVSVRNAWGEEPVYFPDLNFKAVVEEALGITNPTPTDMLGLTSLDASYRGIVDITGIGYAVNLTELDLPINHLSSLSAEIGNLTNLTHLDLWQNQLSSLPSEIGNLTNLTHLDSHGNQLSSLPPEIWNLTNLTYLHLGYNQLSILPVEIGNLTNLTMLNLGVNQLSSLPAEVGYLSSLTDLYLWDNQLSSLPPEIGNLTSLTWLELWSNQLSSLPPEIGNLTSLTTLYLLNNQLSSLPAEIGNLTSLWYLYLWDNPLNTDVYCDIIPLIINNNVSIDIRCDSNPNPLTNDCSTNLLDFGTFQNHWLETDCEPDNNWCGGADINHINNVDVEDLAILCSYWLECGNPLDPDCREDPNGMVWIYILEWTTTGRPGFTGYMSKYETTNAQYCQFLNTALTSGDITVSGNDVLGASGSNSGEDYQSELYYDGDGTGYSEDGALNGGAARIHYNGGIFTVDSGFENHPITYVSWYGATAFCNYYGYRLPTEWEWRAVADYDGSYSYGCGPSINTSIANFYNSIHPDGTTIVGAFGTYGYGMCDMAGNVYEWTSSCYFSDCQDSSRILRGGSWDDHCVCYFYPCSVSNRNYIQYPNATSFNYGFRVCL